MVMERIDSRATADEGGRVVRSSSVPDSPKSAPTKRVVVAYDGSEPGGRALLHAAELVGRGGAVTVVNVVSVQSVGSRLETVSDTQRSTQDRLLREAERTLGRRGVRAEPVRAAGQPATEILSAAEAIGADVIVVGGHRRRMPHLVRSSLAGTLIRRASCDVLVVH